MPYSTTLSEIFRSTKKVQKRANITQLIMKVGVVSPSSHRATKDNTGRKVSEIARNVDLAKKSIVVNATFDCLVSTSRFCCELGFFMSFHA
jgi:hypothetical protein